MGLLNAVMCVERKVDGDKQVGAPILFLAVSKTSRDTMSSKGRSLGLGEQWQLRSIKLLVHKVIKGEPIHHLGTSRPLASR